MFSNRDFSALTIEPVAHIKTDFPGKFGIPRQGELTEELKGKIVFEKKYQKEGILIELDSFSHLWLIFGFHLVDQEGWSATVRPPKLGGNKKVGVFASRSPYRPNPIGLSCVKIQKIEYEKKDGPVIYVTGADLVDGTPIYDIKPYLPYSDIKEDASQGYAKSFTEISLEVVMPDLCEKYDPSFLSSLKKILAQDPRPGFQHEDERSYAFEYAGYRICFHVVDDKILYVDSISKSERAMKALLTRD